MASFWYASCVEDALAGRISFDGDKFGVMLVGAGYKADRLLHSKRSSVAPHEIKGEGYVAGGAEVKVALQRQGALVSVALGAAQWKEASISARGAVYFKRRGGEVSNDELVAFIDFGRDVASTDAPFDLTASSYRIQI